MQDMEGRVPHVAQISFFVDPQGREPARLLDDWPSLVDVAEAASRGGARVTVIQACGTSCTADPQRRRLLLRFPWR